MKWFKFYGAEYLCDPKILTLTASERSCWITLLSYASVNDNNDNENDNGVITFLSEEQILIQSGIGATDKNFNQTKDVLKKLEKLKMITLDNTKDNVRITILNWDKRQETNLTGYERVKRYREKKHSDNKRDNANDNAKITIDKIRVEEIRKDKIKSLTAVAVGEQKNIIFSLGGYLEEMRSKKSPPHIRLIGWYFEKRGCQFPDKATIGAEVKRWVKDASFISKYPVEKITKAHLLVEKKFPDDWNLSTIRKYIAEV